MATTASSKKTTTRKAGTAKASKRTTASKPKKVSAIETLQSQVEKLKATTREVAQLKRALKLSESECNAAGQERDQTQARLEKQKANSSATKTNLSRIRRELDESNRANVGLREKVSALEEQLSDSTTAHRDAMAAQEATLTERGRENVALKKAVASATHTAEIRQAENVRLRRKLDEAEQAAAAEASIDSEEIEAQLAAAERLVTTRDEEISGLRADLSARQEAISARDMEIKAIEAIRILERQNLKARELESNELRLTLSGMDDVIVRRDEEADHLNESLETAKRAANAHEDERKRLLELVAATERTIAARDAEIAALCQANAAHDQCFASRDREITRLETTLENIQQTIADSLRPASALALASTEQAEPCSPQIPHAESVVDRDEEGSDATAEPETPISALAKKPADLTRSDSTRWVRRPSPSHPSVAASSEASEAEPELVEIADSPTDAAEEEAPRRDESHARDIQTYWREKQIRSKLAWEGVGDVEDFFLHHLLAICRDQPERTHRMASLGAGGWQLEASLVHRALEAGVRNFQVHCIPIGPADEPYSPWAGEAADQSIADFIQPADSKIHQLAPTDAFDLCIANQSLQHLEDLHIALPRIKGALGSHGVFVASTPIGQFDRSQAAREIIDQIWPLMPDRYKCTRELKTLPSRYATHARPVRAEDQRMLEILPLLMENFFFEVFIAYGSVINAFVNEEIGANFDPANERDRKFIDRVASLDDVKIDSGLLAPSHLLTTLRTTPVPDPVIYRHWTPEFCLGGEESQRSKGARNAAKRQISPLIDGAAPAHQ
jgi:SAM-dependent methyltransferase